MQYIDIQNFLNELSDLFEDDKQEEFHDLFDSLTFKLNKNVYHFNQILQLIEKSKKSTDDFYQEIHIPIYYEMESLLVSLRSSVDMILHLINFSFDLKLNSFDLTLGNVYNHRSLPKALKNIFQSYTRPTKDNKTWTFIYSSRNLTVHEKSVNQVLPIQIDMFSSDETIVFFEWDDIQRELIPFFKQCLRFLETFCSQMFQAIKISL